MDKQQTLDRVVREVETIRSQLSNIRQTIQSGQTNLEQLRSWREWCQVIVPEIEQLRDDYIEFNFALLDDSEHTVAERQQYVDGIEPLENCLLLIPVAEEVIVGLLEMYRRFPELLQEANE